MTEFLCNKKLLEQCQAQSDCNSVLQYIIKINSCKQGQGLQNKGETHRVLKCMERSIYLYDV